MIRRGEFNHLMDPNNVDNRRGQGNGNRDRQDRQNDRNDRSLKNIPLEISLPLMAK